MSEKERELYINEINEVGKEIKLKAASRQTELDEAIQMMTKEVLPKVTEDLAKIVTSALQIGIEEKALMGHVVGLAGDTLALVRSAYGSKPSPIDGVRISQIDKIPFKILSDCSTVCFDTTSYSAEQMKAIGTKALSGEGLITSCCNLVMAACDMECRAVTENQWTISNTGNPGAFIGHTHSILCAYDNKAGTRHAEKFKSTCQPKANELLNTAITLRKDAASSLEGMAGDIADHLLRAVNVLQEASTVIKSASEFVRKPVG